MNTPTSSVFFAPARRASRCSNWPCSGAVCMEACGSRSVASRCRRSASGSRSATWRGKIDFQTMSRIHTPLTDELTDYIRQVALREPEALRRQREATVLDPQASMQTAPEQGQLLQLLARLAGQQ